MKRFSEADETKMGQIADGIVEKINGLDCIWEQAMEDGKDEDSVDLAVIAELAGDNTEVNEAIAKLITEEFPDSDPVDPDNDEDWEAHETYLENIWTLVNNKILEGK